MNFMKRISVHAKHMPKRFWKRTQDLLRLKVYCFTEEC